MRLCIEYYPNEYPEIVGRLLGRSIFGRIFQKFKEITHYKRNPRDQKYMLALAEKRFGKDFELIQAANMSDFSGADEVVLLWPDGNGYGWAPIEARLLFQRARVSVLNGRQRYFPLTFKSWLGCLPRRFMERFWIGEMVFTAVFLAMTPFLVGKDLVKGRR